MALVKDSLWDIVTGTETLAEGANADARKKFVARSDRALAIIVLAVDPSLLYLLGEPENPGAVWTRQFQRKTWANKLHMRRKLYALRLKVCKGSHQDDDGDFRGCSIGGRQSSLPESFNVLVTALEAQSENVPRWAVMRPVQFPCKTRKLQNLAFKTRYMVSQCK